MMENTSSPTVCRMCLADSIRMYSIRNTRFQQMFEKLTGSKLNIDGRPETICYLCYSQLHRFCRIFKSSQNAENQLKKLTRHGIALVQGLPSLNRVNMHNLSVTPITTMYISEQALLSETDAVKDESVEVVKEESLFFAEIELNIKKEPVEETTLDVDPLQADGTIQLHNMGPSGTSGTIPIHNMDPSGASGTIPIHNVDPLRAGGTSLLCNVDLLEASGTTPLHKMEPSGAGGTSSSHDVDSSGAGGTSRNMYTCDLCNKTFRRKRGLRTHIRKIHSGAKPFSCDICHKTLRIKYNFVKHIKSHTEAPTHACEICTKKFYDRYDLKAHKRIHTRKKAYMQNMQSKI